MSARPIKRLALEALLVIAGAALAPAAAAAEPSPGDRHAAECVAALEVLTEELARQVKAGDEASRATLLDRLVAGTAFVGDTYLHGQSDEAQARALAKQALEAQKSLTPKQLAARQQACADEGTKLYQAANALERAVVRRLATKRMDRLLGA